MNIFELKSLYPGYGGAPVLKNLTMNVGEGEIISIIGPNGAGKSTLLKIMSGDLVPSSGTILFKGRSLREYHPRDLARHCSIVHQAREAVAPFTVHEFIRLGRFPHQGSFVVESERDRKII
jgi:iron complex transport system ATP-binding protein